MERKLIKQGQSTLMVSLPTKWVKDNNLEKGASVQVANENNTISISTHRRIQKKETTFYFDKQKEPSIRCVLLNAYRSGYDTIVITYTSPQQFKWINAVIDDFVIGMEVVSHQKGKCTISNITEPAEEQFEIIYKKVLYNISLLIDITEQRLHGEEPEMEYYSIVKKVHKFDSFCRRVIAKRNLKPGKSELYWTSLTLLNHAHRELYHLHLFLDKNPMKFSRFTMMDQLKKIFGHVSDLAIKKKKESLEKIHSVTKNAVQTEFYERIQKGKKEAIVLYHLAGAIRTFYLSASPLLSLALQD